MNINVNRFLTAATIVALLAMGSPAQVFAQTCEQQDWKGVLDQGNRI
jgi:hypothetical protein